MTFHPRRNGFLGLSGWEAWRALRRGAGLIQKERIQPPRRSPGRSKWEGRSLRRTEGARTRTTGVALSMHALPDSALPSLGSSDRAAGHCYLDMEPQSRGSTGPPPALHIQGPEVSPPRTQTMRWRPGSRWDHGSSRRPEGTHGSLRPGSVPPKDQRAQGTPGHTSSLAPSPPCRCRCPGSPVAVGWTQQGVGEGRNARAVGPAHSGRWTQLPQGGAGLVVSEALSPGLWAGEAALGPEAGLGL